MIDAYLGQLSLTNLKQVARHHGITAVREENLLESLSRNLQDPGYLRQLYRQLTEFEQFVLHEFIFTIGTELFSSRQLEQWQGKMSNSEFRIGFTKLRQKGFIFTLRRMWGEVAYIFPEDLFRTWSGVVLAIRKVSDDINHIDSEHITITQSRLLGIDQDLFHLLASISKVEMSVTQKGAIYKRYVTKISEGFVDRLAFLTNDGKTTELSLINSKRYDPEVYSPLFAIVMQLAERLGFIRVDNGVIGLHARDVQKWIQLPSSRKMTIIYDLWALIRPVFKEQWLHFVQTMMNEIPHGQWKSVNDLVVSLEEVIGPDVDGIQRKAIFTSLLTPLHYLGFIEHGMLESIGEVWRWVPFDTDRIEETKFYVQPNFEVLLPPHFSTEAHWTLSQMANVVRSDQMIVYHITEESFTNALEMGYSSEEMLSYLSSHCAVPLPANVETSLRQWGLSYGRVRFLDVMVMECSDALLVDELLQQPKLAEGIIKRMSPTHVLVYRDDVAHLRTWLERHGYSPMKRILTMDKDNQPLRVDTSTENNDHPGTEIHFLTKTLNLNDNSDSQQAKPIDIYGYRVENVFPEIEEAVPGLKQIPKMWIDQYRTYHKSTLRDLLLKAIDLKLKVRMTYEQKEYEDMLPTVMRNVGGTWWLETEQEKEKTSFNIDSIDKVQLIKPSIG